MNFDHAPEHALEVDVVAGHSAVTAVWRLQSAETSWSRVPAGASVWAYLGSFRRRLGGRR